MLGSGLLLAGCSSNGSADFEGKSKAQQVDALRGSVNQLTPERRKQIEAQAQAMMAAHARQGGPGQAGQTQPPGGSR